MSVIFCQRVWPGSLCFIVDTGLLLAKFIFQKQNFYPLHIMDNTFKTLWEESIVILFDSSDPPLDLTLPMLIEKVFAL